MFRDFAYLDTNRVQSILAQLEQGLLTQLAQSRAREVMGQAGLGEGFFAQLLPLSGSVEGKLNFSSSHNKILHDYAFTLGLQSLQKNNLLLNVDDLGREEGDVFPVPEAAFVLVKGSARLLDYAILSSVVEQLPILKELYDLIPSKQSSQQNAAQSEESQVSSHNQPDTNRILTRAERRSLERQQKSRGRPIPQQPNTQATAENNHKTSPEKDRITTIVQAISQTRALFDMFLGDVIQFNLTTHKNVTFIGDLNREFLREDIRSLIFKYGSNPQGEWSMLAQVSSIPEPDQAKESWNNLGELFKDFDWSNLRSGADFFDLILRGFNSFQEISSSVGYPDVAVAPIAIYREIDKLQ